MKRPRILSWLSKIAVGSYLLFSRPAPKAEAADQEARQRQLSQGKKVGVAVVLLLAVGGAGAVFCLMFSGPRMRDEPKFTPHRALLPESPAGIVPVAFTEARDIASLRNPLADTARTRRVGQVYYGYYCAFCHGKDGRGAGPVGRSYVPAPADLTAASVQNLPDGALYQALRTGVGHAPVLDYVIDPNALWYLVHYVRHLSAQAGEPS